jgi:hypothetical protein
VLFVPFTSQPTMTSRLPAVVVVPQAGGVAVIVPVLADPFFCTSVIGI